MTLAEGCEVLESVAVGMNPAEDGFAGALFEFVFDGGGTCSSRRRWGECGGLLRAGTPGGCGVPGAHPGVHAEGDPGDSGAYVLELRKREVRRRSEALLPASDLLRGFPVALLKIGG